MPQVYKKTEKCKRSPKEILLMAGKDCDKRQSIGKAALLFNLDKMTLYQYLNKKKFWTRMCIWVWCCQSGSHYFSIRYGKEFGCTY